MKEALIKRIEEYLSGGGLFNPEMANHIAVRDLLIECRIALAQPEQHQDWCASLTQLLMSMPPKPAPCNCKPPQRTWVELTDDEIEARAINFYNPEMYKRAVLWAQEKLKEKNQ